MQGNLCQQRENIQRYSSILADEQKQYYVWNKSDTSITNHNKQTIISLVTQGCKQRGEENPKPTTAKVFVNEDERSKVTGCATTSNWELQVTNRTGRTLPCPRAVRPLKAVVVVGQERHSTSAERKVEYIKFTVVYYQPLQINWFSHVETAIPLWVIRQRWTFSVPFQNTPSEIVHVGMYRQILQVGQHDLPPLQYGSDCRKRVLILLGLYLRHPELPLDRQQTSVRGGPI